jgi:tetratricopeptide (TPR) repeat protein
MKPVLLLALGLLGMLPPQGQPEGQNPERSPFLRPPLELVRKDGSSMHFRANRSGMSAWSVLRYLEDQGAFTLILDIPQLTEQLQSQAVNLAFEEMDAVDIARLVCVVAGLDLIEEYKVQKSEKSAGQESAAPVKPHVTVVNPPVGDTQSGRDRLRALAIEYYDRLLYEGTPDPLGATAREIAKVPGLEPLPAKAKPFDVRFDRGRLRKEMGDYSAAAEEFEAAADNVAPEVEAETRQKYECWALYWQAVCFLEMGEYEKAQSLSREVNSLYEGRRFQELCSVVMEGKGSYRDFRDRNGDPEPSPAVVFGRSALAIARENMRAAQTLRLELRGEGAFATSEQRRDVEHEAAKLEGKAQATLSLCISEFSLLIGGFANSDDLAEIHLLLAEAQWLRSNYSRVLEELLRVPDLDNRSVDLSRSEQGTMTFLSGVAKGRTGKKPLEGESDLHDFLCNYPDHRLIPSAWAEMAALQWRLDDPLQTLFACRKAHDHASGLLPREADQVVILEAKALMALGQIETTEQNIGAIRLLREAIQERGPGYCPMIEVFAGEALLTLGRSEHAKNVLRNVVDRRGALGEQARVLYMQSLASQELWEQLVLFGLEYGELIRDPARQARVSELLGDAYTSLGRHELAAEAYAGRIR